MQDMDIEHEVLRRQVEMAKNLEFLRGWMKATRITLDKIVETWHIFSHANLSKEGFI
jgi:hypothetical protein